MKSSLPPNARWIVCEASGYDRAELGLVLDEPASNRAVHAVDELVARRGRGEPLQYVLGNWGFCGIDLNGMASFRRARLGLARTFQQIELFGGLTVLDHLLVAVRAQRQFGAMLRDLLGRSLEGTPVAVDLHAAMVERTLDEVRATVPGPRELVEEVIARLASGLSAAPSERPTAGAPT